MVKFYMMIGLPASGKSTIAKEIAERESAVIVSTDDLRQELLNDVNSQENNNLIFKEAERHLKTNIEAGRNVIFDATNINYKRRRDWLNRFNKYNVRKIGVLVATPYEECLERNIWRERKVPEEVIKRMYFNFYIPFYYEGFNEIYVIQNETKPLEWNNLLEKMNISQDNPNHSLTIKEHCLKTQEILDKSFHCYYMRDVGLLHDIGKIETKTFTNMKGEITDIAHYYSHEKVGAYISCLRIDGLCQMTDPDIIKRAILIQWHMLLHQNLSEKAITKYKNMLGESMWRDLELLHKADCEAR